MINTLSKFLCPLKKNGFHHLQSSFQLLHVSAAQGSGKKVLWKIFYIIFNLLVLFKESDQMSLAKKVDPREAAARKAAEEATKRALDKKRKEEESKKEK